jgi:ABC-type bacteriocin/lantibiotic exporter with double-glycine peptidase domain
MARSGFNSSGSDATAELPKPKVNKESLKRSLRIFRYVLPYKGLFSVGLMMLLLSSSTFMAFPFLAGKLIDAANHKPVVLPNGIELGIDRIAILLFTIIVFQGFFSFGRIWFFTQVSEFTVRDIRKALYAKFVQLPIPFFEQNRVGAITSRITSDVGQIQDTFSLTLAELFRQIFTLVIGITAIMVVHAAHFPTHCAGGGAFWAQNPHAGPHHPAGAGHHQYHRGGNPASHQLGESFHQRAV